MERRLQGKLLRKAVCLAVVGASLTYGGTVFAATTTLTKTATELTGSQQAKYAAILVSSGEKNVGSAEDTLVFESVKETTNDPNNCNGTAYSAAYVYGGSTLNITADTILIGTAEQGGDRGFRLGTNAGNTLNIDAKRIISYTGDEFVHVRDGGGAGTSVANVGSAEKPIEYFEAHTTWGKGDYGVAILQANEGNTINFYAKEASFDGSTNIDGGVFGSGSDGTVNVTTDKLTIDGNICGTYGTTKTAKALNITVNTKTLNATGAINAGVRGEGYSTNNFRTTNVNVAATDTSVMTGEVRAFEHGNIKLNMDGANSTFTGNLTAVKGGTIDMTMGANSIFKGDISATDKDSTVALKGNAVSEKIQIEAGKISADNGGIISLDNAVLSFTELTDNEKAGTVNLGAGVTLKGEKVELKQDLNLDNGSDITGAAIVSNATVNVAAGSDATVSDLTVTDGKLEVAGNLNAPTLKIAGNSNVAVTGTLTTTTADLGSAAVSVDGALKATDLNKESGALDVAGNVEVTNATLGSGTALTVGNDAKAGSFKAEKVDLAAGSSIFLDPAFQDGATIAGASVAGVDTFTSGIAGDLAVGRNSILAAGSTDAQWAYNAFNNNASGWTWGEGQVAAALALKSAQTMAATGSITVDGSLTAAPTATANTATFAADSILIVDAAGIGTNAALTSTNGTLNVASGAKVLISGATDETNYQIVDGFAGDNANADNWTVGTDDRVLTAKINTDTAKQGDVFVKMNSNSVMNTTALGKVYQALYAAGLNNTSSPNAAIAALSQAASKKFVASDALAVAAVNNAAGITVIGGQQNATLNGVKLFTGALQNHMTEKPSDSHIWAEYLHSNSKVRDVSLANSSFGYDNKFNGAVVGADFLATDTKHAGVAFAYGEGKVSGVSNNDYKTWGLDLYHAWHNEKATIMADLGYMKNDGEIKQSTLLGNINTDPTSTAWTAGVRGDFKLANDNITPYAGLRYVRLTTDSHNVNSAAGTLMNVGKDTQNLWLLPVGVQFSKRIQKGNGVFVPKAEIGALFAFGDKDTNASLSVPGISATDNLGVSITDSASFLGSLGFTYETKKVNYGLAYQLQTGSKETRNGMWANVEFKF